MLKSELEEKVIQLESEVSKFKSEKSKDETIDYLKEKIGDLRIAKTRAEEELKKLVSIKGDLERAENKSRVAMLAIETLVSMKYPNLKLWDVDTLATSEDERFLCHLYKIL